MTDQMDWTEDKGEEAGSRPGRGRKSASARRRGATGSTEGEADLRPATAEAAAAASPRPREEGDDADAGSPVGESEDVVGFPVRESKDVAESGPEESADAARPQARKRAREDATPAQDTNPLTFTDVEHLTRKGLRILPVVTGAVVDAAGNFLFYLDGHDDARSGVQAQLNHLLQSGPSRAEHLGPARARASYLATELARSR